MSRQTTLWLTLLLALLATLVWWQQGREEEGDFATDRALFPGIDPALVRSIRVDHLERGVQVTLERDAQGGWYLSDPLVYPADLGVVQQLLQMIGRARGMPVIEEQRDPARLGLDPPRAILEVETVAGTDAEGASVPAVKARVELGALDLDGVRVNVRADGHLLRALRDLDTTLDREVHDYRSHRALDLPPRAVALLHRTGRWQEDLAREPVDLELHAYREGRFWRSSAPRAAWLDPLEVEVLLLGTVGLPIDAFVDDAPVGLEPYGLHEPTLRVDLRTAEGDGEDLLVGRPDRESSWFAMRAGAPHVWRVAPEGVAPLTRPFEELLDRRLLRILRDEVTALVLRTGADELRLTRAGEDAWRLRVVRGDVIAVEDAPADARRVDDALARLEQLELTSFLLDAAQDPADFDQELLVEAGGAVFGGRIGGPVVDEKGDHALLFQRVDEDVVATVDPWVGEFAAARAEDLLDRRLVDVAEIDLVGLRLEHGGTARAFERSDRGRWSPRGEEGEARALLPVLDPLLFLRAERYLAPDVAPAPGDPVTVTFLRRDGTAAAVTIGADGRGGSVARLGGRTALLSVADLHERLLALFL